MIDDFGWSPALQRTFDLCGHPPDRRPARVIAQQRNLWRLATELGERPARISGRFAFSAARGEFPVVGDWVAASELTADEALIHGVLPRSGAFRRREAGGEGAQIICANVDVAFLVTALNGDLSPARVERYLVTARDAGAEPVVVLTKADLAAALDEALGRIAAVASGAAVVALSALRGQGLEQLAPWLRRSASCVLLGSSGAGKSTLLNALMGAEAMRTGEIRRSDDRGRHTTTHREMFQLPGGALLIDTPGMRELGLVADTDAVDASFADVAELASRCRFGDCSHGNEPGCAVQAALQSGALDERRWRAFGKLQREVDYAERRGDPAAEAEARQKWKRIHKAQRARYKARDREQDG
jgi:ribosome biogenesis GTPase / thiamine phosphate phosphatase